MSYLFLNHAIINKKIGDVNERRTEHSQEGLRGVGNNSKGISRKIKHWSVICFRVEQWKQKDTKWNAFSLRTSYRKPSTQKRFRDNRRVQRNIKQNKIINIFLISDKKLDFVLKIDYNPIILKIKGLDMLQNAQQITTGQGYITWVMAVSRDVNLEFRELREAFDKALEFVGVSRKEVA